MIGTFSFKQFSFTVLYGPGSDKYRPAIGVILMVVKVAIMRAGVPSESALVKVLPVDQYEGAPLHRTTRRY